MSACRDVSPSASAPNDHNENDHNESMDEPTEDTGERLDAGSLAEWVPAMRLAIRGAHDADVPCGSCTACCTSSQFIHIAPDETAALRRIPKALLFPAPRLPAGHVVMGFTERGHCPMFVDNACSIYDDRPQTCRTYDCRIFTATGVDAYEDGRHDIARRTRAWEFTADESGSVAVTSSALRAAADFLRTHRSSIPSDLAPTTATQLAVMAFELHELFITENEQGVKTVSAPTVSAFNTALLARRRQ